MLKILIATGLYPPDVGGPATYSKILFDELPKRGIGVEVLSFGEVRYLPKIIRHAVYFVKILKLGRSADIIFAQDPVSVGLPAMIAAKILRKRFLLKIVGDYAWEQGVQRFGVKEMLDDFLNKKYEWDVEILRKTEKLVAKSAEKIIVPSEYLKNVVIKWGADPEKIHVIYNAFDFQREAKPERGFGEHDTPSEQGEARKAQRLGFSLSTADSQNLATKELTRAELGLEGKVLVSAGRLLPWKGFEILIEAVRESLISFPDIKLMIIGDGPERGKLERQIANYKMQGTVTLRGALPRGELLKYLKAADVFVLNTSYEGFSHQILEAMAMGVSVVTTNVGGNPELIKDGESGFLFKFNDKKALKEKISQILLDSALAKKLSDGAQKKAREFSLERMINETIRVFG